MNFVVTAGQVYEVRWREGGRHKSLTIHGDAELAKKVLRKRMSLRDENRHRDSKKDINYRMPDLIERYWTHYSRKKLSMSREKGILAGIRSELGGMFERGRRHRRAALV